MWNRWFEHPVWLWLPLIAGPILAALEWRAIRLRHNRNVQLGLATMPRSWLRAAAYVSAILLFTIAAAGPRWGQLTDTPTAAGRDLVIVIDVSRSMLARDVIPDRLGRAKEIATEVVEAIARRGGHRIGVVAFAAKPIELVPLTYDLGHVRHVLVELDPLELTETRASQAVSGTRIGMGLEMGLATLEVGHRGAGDLLLLSDGDDPARDGEWLRGAAAAVRYGVSIDVIGIGDPERDSPVPGRLESARTRLLEGPLRELAGTTGGRFLSAGTAQIDAAGFVRAAMADRPTADDPETVVARPPARPAMFLTAGLVLLFLALTPTFGSPQRKQGVPLLALRAQNNFISAAIVFLALAIMAAAPVDDWMRRGDAALAAGEPEQALRWYGRAAERTPDPGLAAFNQGIALAALGRYRDAELHFRRSLTDAEGDRRTKALYNLGTCLVRRCAGREREPLRAAVAALEEALGRLPPDDPLAADVRQNLEIAEKLLAHAPPDAPASKQESEPGDGPPASSKPGPAKPSDAPKNASANTEPDSKAANAETKDAPRPTDRPPPLGTGTLPPVPDTDKLTPLLPEDLAAHLQRAVERIAAARRDRLKAKEMEKPLSYPDW